MKQHKQEAFLNVYETCHDDFARYCSALTFGKMDVEDLMQEVLLSAYKHFDQIERKEQLLHYLIRAARNRAISLWRRAKFRPEMLAQKHENIHSTATTAETQVDVQLLYKAMDKLPKKQRDALILFEVNGFSMREIAKMQHSSEGAVKTKISRGRKKLRLMMAERGKTPMFFGIPLSIGGRTGFPNARLQSLFEQSHSLIAVPSKDVVLHSFQQELSRLATRHILQVSFFNRTLINFTGTSSINTAFFIGSICCFLLPPSQLDYETSYLSEASIGAILLPSVLESIAMETSSIYDFDTAKLETKEVEIEELEVPTDLPKSIVEAPITVQPLPTTSLADISLPIQLVQPETIVEEKEIELAPKLTPTIQNNEAYLYGKVTTTNGTPYIGQLRWGKEEALWTDYFDASKGKNENINYLSKKELRELKEENFENANVSIFSINNRGWNVSYNFSHLFSCQFGELQSIRRSTKLKTLLTLKNGIEIPMKGGSNDIGSDIYVYLEDGSKMKVQWENIRIVDFAATPADWKNKIGTPLYGTVKAEIGEFDGLVIWDQEERLDMDILDGDENDKSFEIEFGNIRSIKNEGDACRVTLKDGTIRELSDTNDVDSRNDGIEIMIPGEGRISVDWKDFEEVTFSDVPTVKLKRYSDFTSPRLLKGSVTTKEGATLSGKLIYDLDERYDFEMLNGQIKEVEFDIPFRLIQSITPKRSGKSRIMLKSGRSYELDGAQDVNSDNTGVLIFQNDKENPSYVSWKDIEKVELE